MQALSDGQVNSIATAQQIWVFNSNQLIGIGDFMPKFVRVLMQNLTGSNPPPKNSSIYHYHLEVFFPDFGPPRKHRVPGCCAAPQPFPAPSTGQVRRKWGPGVHEPQVMA